MEKRNWKDQAHDRNFSKEKEPSQKGGSGIDQKIAGLERRIDRLRQNLNHLQEQLRHLRDQLGPEQIDAPSSGQNEGDAFSQNGMLTA